MVDYTKAQSPGFVPPSPAEQGEQAVKDAAGKVASRSRGQGFQLEQEVKVAVEALAMNMATEFDSKDWDVEDIHGTENYDLICRRGDEVKHVEVKGTTTDRAEVILTRERCYRPLDANEILTVARWGFLSLDACLIKEIERSSRLHAASCRPVMAPRLAPQPGRLC